MLRLLTRALFGSAARTAETGRPPRDMRGAGGRRNTRTDSAPAVRGTHVGHNEGHRLHDAGG
eukprot:3797795-Pyramimonas_sp.AAC.1